MSKNMIVAEYVTPGMKIAFDIMGDTVHITPHAVCVTPYDAKFNGSTCEFKSSSGHRIVVEPWTMVEVLSYPVPEPLTIGSRVLAGDNAFLRISGDPQIILPWIDVKSGNRYHWAALSDLFGAVTVLDDNPTWAVDSSKSETETVELLNSADTKVIYRDKDGDLWAYYESYPGRWVLYEQSDVFMPDSSMGPFEPFAQKVNK